MLYLLIYHEINSRVYNLLDDSVLTHVELMDATLNYRLQQALSRFSAFIFVKVVKCNNVLP